jgi:hypothetical protein
MKISACALLLVMASAAPAFANASGPNRSQTVSLPNRNESGPASSEIAVPSAPAASVPMATDHEPVSSSASIDNPALLKSCGNGVLPMFADGLSARSDESEGLSGDVVQQRNPCDGGGSAPIDVTFRGSGTVLPNLQLSGGWNGWGELPPDYTICDAPCEGVTWFMTQGASSPSLSGHSTRFDIGGSTPYSDVLWSIPLIGEFSTQNLPDSDHTLIPAIHNFTYDAWVYVTNVAATQSLEFDINVYMGGVGMLWGTQCNHLADGDWDIWDNINAKWVSSGATCSLINGWNHVTIQAQRESNNVLLYESITLNGVTSEINRIYAPFSIPASWWGVTVNYQMDGNYNQSANTTYLDNLSLTYW